MPSSSCVAPDFNMLAWACARLAASAGRVMSRQALLERVWEHGFFGDERLVDVHVRRLRAKLGDLEQLIGMIASTPLHRDRPLWELHYCEGLEGGRVAVVGKMHHALADGATMTRLSHTVLYDEAPAGPATGTAASWTSTR